MIHKKIIRLLVAAVLALTTGLLAAAPAHADPSYNVGDRLKITNQHTSTCLDDSWQYGLRMYPCNWNSEINGYQEFRILKNYLPSGWTSTPEYLPLQLQNVNTGQCIDGSARYGYRHHDCSDASWQNGYQVMGIPNIYNNPTPIRAGGPDNPGCLDAGQGNLSYSCWYGDWQQWSIIDFGP